MALRLGWRPTDAAGGAAGGVDEWRRLLRRHGGWASRWRRGLVLQQNQSQERLELLLASAQTCDYEIDAVSDPTAEGVDLRHERVLFLLLDMGSRDQALVRWLTKHMPRRRRRSGSAKDDSGVDNSAGAGAGGGGGGGGAAAGAVGGGVLDGVDESGGAGGDSAGSACPCQAASERRTTRAKDKGKARKAKMCDGCRAKRATPARGTRFALFIENMSGHSSKAHGTGV